MPQVRVKVQNPEHCLKLQDNRFTIGVDDDYVFGWKLEHELTESDKQNFTFMRYQKKVIFRKVKSGEFKGQVDAIFPDTLKNGMIEGYSHIGQHFEASIIYAQKCLVKCSENEYSSLLNELKKIYDDCDLIVTNRLDSKSFWK